jgi:hypothetical protein
MFTEILRVICGHVVFGVRLIAASLGVGVASVIATGITRSALRYLALCIADGDAEQRQVAYDDFLLEAVYEPDTGWRNRAAVRLALAIT